MFTISKPCDQAFNSVLTLCLVYVFLSGTKHTKRQRNHPKTIISVLFWSLLFFRCLSGFSLSGPSVTQPVVMFRGSMTWSHPSLLSFCLNLWVRSCCRGLCFYPSVVMVLRLWKCSENSLAYAEQLYGLCSSAGQLITQKSLPCVPSKTKFNFLSIPFSLWHESSHQRPYSLSPVAPQNLLHRWFSSGHHLVTCDITWHHCYMCSFPLESHCRVSAGVDTNRCLTLASQANHAGLALTSFDVERLIA